MHLLPLRLLLSGSVIGSFLAPPQETPPAATERALAEEAAAVAAGLADDLARSLTNRLRVLDVAAHPDDEDGALLCTYALQGAEIATVFSTRGEGGQNAIGSELFAQLGERREAETLAASRIVGSTPWFLGLPDFGFSKRADEAFARWGGRDEVVRRLTWILRRLRPHLVFTNHPQTGGHGHHQATSIALHEAVVAAADPARYPEQLTDGLAVWSADALFVRLWKGDPPPDTSLHLDYDLPSAQPDTTIAAVARSALMAHASQGPWSPLDPKERHETNYVLSWSARELRSLRELPSHTTRLLERAADAPFTVDDLLALLATPGFTGANAPSEERVSEWLTALTGIDVTLVDELADAPRHALLAGESLPCMVLLHGRDDLYRGASCAAALRKLELAVRIEGPATITARRTLDELAPDPEQREIWRNTFVHLLEIDVARNAAPSWPGPAETKSPYSGARGYPLALRVELRRPERPATTPAVHAAVATLRVPIEKSIAPSVLAELARDPLPLVRRPGSGVAHGSVRLTFPTGRVPNGALELHAPAGFRFATPSGTRPSLPIQLTAESNLATREEPRFEIAFTLEPQQLAAKAPDGTTRYTPIELPLTFDDGTVITTVHGAIAWIEVLPPTRSRVAFVAGSDGFTGSALTDLGVDWRPLTPERLAAEELREWTHVLLDARTLGTSETLRAQSPRLRDWIHHGGNVIVLYHKSGEWNPWVEKELVPAPLPLKLTDVRVCEEASLVSILTPGHDRLLHPNVILASDFDGWVQERALYLPDQSYDAGYQELLECADAGEEGHRGALLCWTGAEGGSFIYCALALSRQLRAGHSGAWRLLANLLEPARLP